MIAPELSYYPTPDADETRRLNQIAHERSHYLRRGAIDDLGRVAVLSLTAGVAEPAPAYDTPTTHEQPAEPAERVQRQLGGSALIDSMYRLQTDEQLAALRQLELH